MRDVVVLEAAHDVHDRVGLADVREELVAEPFAFGGALHEAGDVDELHDRGHGASSACTISASSVEPRVGDLDHADVRLDGAERIVRRFRLAAVSALNSVDLPTLGSPTIPSFSILLFTLRDL